MIEFLILSGLMASGDKVMFDGPLESAIVEQHEVGETVQSPATQAQVDSLKASLRDEFDASLPADYERFLLRANGLDFNGLVLYGASQSNEEPGAGSFWQGLVAANHEWRSTGDHDEYLILGDTDMELLTVAPDATNAALRDRVSGDVLQTYPSVNAMLEDSLRQRL
ncbi:MAG: YrhA family protein [Pseudomonadota bacterium]